MEIKPQLKPRGSVGKEEDPKPSNQVYKLQIKSTLSNRKTVSIDSSYKKKKQTTITKEKALVLIHVDIGGKNTQKWNQIRLWAAHTVGPEVSTVMTGILGRGGGLWIQVRERTLAAMAQDKHVWFFSFDLLCRFFWIFSLSSRPHSHCCSCQFYWHYEIKWSFWAMFLKFPLSHFYSWYKPLLLCRPFAVL